MRSRSEVASEHVQRWAVLAGGREELFPVVDLTPPFETMTIASRDGDALVHALQSRMRAAEASLAHVARRRSLSSSPTGR